jgi:DNA-binding transcriptional LysR family regulator
MTLLPGGGAEHREARDRERGADELRAGDGRRQRTVVEARIASNDQVALQQMCEHGLGIARLVRVDVLPSLERGALVPVLAGWRQPALPVWALTPRRDRAAAKVRAGLDHLKRHFAAIPRPPAD